MALIAEKQSPTVELTPAEHLLGCKLTFETFEISGGDASDVAVTVKTKMSVIYNIFTTQFQTGGTPFTGDVRCDFNPGDADANGDRDLVLTTSVAMGASTKCRVTLIGYV